MQMSAALLGFLVVVISLVPTSPRRVSCAVRLQGNAAGALPLISQLPGQDPDLFPTGISDFPFARKEALRDFYVVLRDAEDNPQRHYHAKLVFDDAKTLTKVEVQSAEMRPDPGIKVGDNVCILTGMTVGAATGQALGKLVDRICLQRIVAPATIATWLGVSTAGSPFLGVPAGFAVAVAGRGACWATSEFAKWAAGGLAGTATEYYCTLLRTDPARYPGDQPTSNVYSSPPLPQARPYPDLTEGERAWRQHRDAIDFLKEQHRIRAGAYPGLTPKQIEERVAYAKRVAQQSRVAWAFRQDLAYRQTAWSEYLQNKLATRQTVVSQYQLRVSAEQAADNDLNHYLGRGTIAAHERMQQINAQLSEFMRSAGPGSAFDDADRERFASRLGDSARGGARGGGYSSGAASDPGAGTNDAMYPGKSIRGGCDASEGMCAGLAKRDADGQYRIYVQEYDPTGVVIIGKPRRKQ